MSKLTHIKGSDRLASAELGEAIKANEPQGTPVAMIRSKDWRKGPDAGVWEIAPGRWKRGVKNAEFVHFVKGRCEFHHEGGTVLSIEPGDAVFFPAHTTGTWNVIETVRKTYFLLPLD
jgi:uncharacterized cupin superfamily protein